MYALQTRLLVPDQAIRCRLQPASMRRGSVPRAPIRNQPEGCYSSKPQKTHLLPFRSIYMRHQTVLLIPARQRLCEDTCPRGDAEAGSQHTAVAGDADGQCQWGRYRREMLSPTPRPCSLGAPGIQAAVNHWQGPAEHREMQRDHRRSQPAMVQCQGSARCRGPQQPQQEQQWIKHPPAPRVDEQKGLLVTSSPSKSLWGQSSEVEGKAAAGPYPLPSHGHRALSPQLL